MSLPEEDRFDWKEIFELFHKPDVKDFDFNFKKLNEEKIKKILVEEHDFSEVRVDNQLEKLREAKEAKKQKTLADW